MKGGETSRVAESVVFARHAGPAIGSAAGLLRSGNEKKVVLIVRSVQVNPPENLRLYNSSALIVIVRH